MEMLKPISGPAHGIVVDQNRSPDAKSNWQCIDMFEKNEGVLSCQ